MINWYRKLTFSHKLLIVFFMIITIPILSLTFFEYNYSKNILEEKTNVYLKSVSAVTMSKIESTVKDIEDMAFYINGNSVIQSSLKAENEVIDDRQEYYELHSNIRDIIASFALQRREISSISIFSSEGERYTYTKDRGQYTIANKEYHTDEKQYWAIEDAKIVLEKQIYRYPTQEKLGYLSIVVREKSLYEIISDIEYSEVGEVYLIDSFGKIVSTKDKALLGQYLEPQLIDCVSESAMFYSEVVRDNISYSVYNSEPISNGWHMMLVIPRDYYVKDITYLYSVNIILALFTMLIASVVAILLSRSITKPIRELTGAMQLFGQGDFDINCRVDTEDEIGLLSNTFNQMVLDMNQMVTTVYEQKVMKQEAEMKSLQMQINPHFLYNTLETINWLARIKEVDEIGDMVSALGNLMRYSLDNRAFVKMSEELENLNNYVAIQKIRYEDEIEFNINIDESFMNYYVPKLLIQPILENAIVHGLEEKLENGSVSVNAISENNDLYIIIIDDGVGMTEETISKILNEDYTSEKRGHTSIGIVNVNKRIQMIYGSEYGLSVQSSLGAGTKMTLHIKLEDIARKM